MSAQGGNAFDMTVAALACLSVEMPTSIGFGGDLVALFSAPSSTGFECIVACGPAPLMLPSCEQVVDLNSAASASVPGFLPGLQSLAERGCLGVEAQLTPALALTRRGFVTSDQFRRWAAHNADVLDRDPMLKRLFFDGSAPRDHMTHAPLADLYAALSDDWEGAARALHDAVVQRSQAEGGTMTKSDLEAATAEVVPSLAATIGGSTVHVTPSPTPGPLTLLGLRELERQGRDPHTLVEVLRQCLDRRWQLEERGSTSTGDLFAPLEPVPAFASGPRPTFARTGDTTCLVAADAAGNLVAVVGSISLGFGCGVGALDGAVILNNRLGRAARSFGVASLRPGAMPPTTLMAWGHENSSRRCVGATPGGDAQVEWNSQVLADLTLDGRSDAEALAAGRLVVYPSPDHPDQAKAHGVEVDGGYPDSDVRLLRDRGHVVRRRTRLPRSIRMASVTAGRPWAGADQQQEDHSANA